MTKEEKNLLLRDLSARLPYGVKGVEANALCSLNTMTYFKSIVKNIEYKIEYLGFRPYLFPFSSMTEEERAERIRILWELEGHIDEDVTYKYQDWLNKHHFDYRGLIPMGLAIDASGLNIYD